MMSPGVTHSAPSRSTRVNPNSINAHLEMPHTVAAPLTQAAAGSRGERRWRRSVLPAKQDWRGVWGGLNRSDGRKEGESDRKQVGRIMVACLGAKLIGETLQRRTVGVHHANKEKTTRGFSFQHFHFEKTDWH